MAFHEELRNHRLKKGLILEEISEETKINVRILQALEQGDFHILPIPYVRIFMKAYAQAIDYPVEDIIRGLENELQLTGEQRLDLPMPNANEVTDGSTGGESSAVSSAFLGDKSNQNTVLRFVAGLAVVLLVIVVGKGLLQPEPAPTKDVAPLLPAMNENQPLDSLTVTHSSDTLKPLIQIRASGFLSIVNSDAEGNRDTVYLGVDQTQEFKLQADQQLACFPSEFALLLLESDTLPATPFTNSWMVIQRAGANTTIRTFAAY